MDRWTWAAGFSVMPITYLIVATVILGASLMQTASCDASGAGEDSGSGDGMDRILPNATNSRCIPLSDAVERSLIFDLCIDYFPAEKQFIFDYGINFQTLIRDLTLLNSALSASSLASPFCMDLTRDYTCNYVYPGCSNETGLPQGICTEECQRYVLTDVCRGEFNTLETVTITSGSVTITRQCDDTLLLLKDFGINNETVNDCDCINITDTLTESPPDASNVGFSTSIEVTVTSSESGSPQLDLLWIILATSGGLVILSCLALTVIIVCSWRARRTKKKLLHLLESGNGQLLPNNYQLQLIESNHHDYDDVAPDLFQLSEEDVHAFGTNVKLREVLVPFDNLQITGELGEGAFGRVFKGILQTEQVEGGSSKALQVAIKTIKNTQGMYRELKAFIEESALMCSFNHPHVLGMVGICLDTVQSPYLLLPYMANGDLRTFLRNKRDCAKSSDTGYPEGLEYNLLVRLCYEIATGMEYLASKKLVHRDLAARNCMVDQDLTVKVADFGLARVIYHSDYYRQHQQTKVPVKWMAPESLHDMISTEKSDVWSYGVVCWEVFSLGRLPYPTLANHEVVDYLERGNRLKKPALCSDVIYDLTQSCWEDEPEKRPTFTEIVSRYHSDGLISDNTSIINKDTGYVLLGLEEPTREDPQEKEAVDFADESESLMNAILTHFQKTPPASFILDTLLNPSSRSRAATLPATLPDIEYYMDMNSSSLGGSVFVNQMMHEYDNISLGEEAENGDDHENHMISSTDHVTRADGQEQVPKCDLSKSNSDYILMQSAEPVNPPTCT